MFNQWDISEFPLKYEIYTVCNISEWNEYIGSPLCTAVDVLCLIKMSLFRDMKQRWKNASACLLRNNVIVDGWKHVTLDNDKGTYLDKVDNARCTLAFDNFYHERLTIVIHPVKAGLMHCEWEQGKRQGCRSIYIYGKEASSVNSY